MPILRSPAGIRWSIDPRCPCLHCSVAPLRALKDTSLPRRMWTFLLLVVLGSGMGRMSQGGSDSTRRVSFITLCFFMVDFFPAIPAVTQSTHFPPHRFILQPIQKLLSPKAWVEALWGKTCVD